MRRTSGAAVAAMVVVLAPAAGADEIISNLPGDDGSQAADLKNGRIKAMGFTMPAGDDYRLDSADIRLDVRGLAIDPLVRIFDDVGGFPTTELIELADPSFTVIGIDTYSFTPPEPFVLEAGQTYWLVVYNLGPDRLDWKASSPSVAPTGIATHVGSYFSVSGPNPPTDPSGILSSYAIQGAAGSVCYPDCDESGSLDFFDFLCFQNAFAAGEAYADCDASGDLDFFDFLCFQNEFAAGCP